MSGSVKYAVWAAVVGALFGPVFAQAPAKTGDQVSAAAQETDDFSELWKQALDLVNGARADAGLTDLAPSDVLDRAAQGHASDMLERGFFGHVTPEGGTPFERFLAAGGNRWAVNGENIATCKGCPAPPDTDRLRAFHEGWMQSPGHRENILFEGFDSFGFGIAGGGDEIFAVQAFSGPGSDTDASGAAEPLPPGTAREIALKEINVMHVETVRDPLGGLPRDVVHADRAD